MANRYIVGLDIGSSKISCALAVLENRKIVDLLVAQRPCRGVREGGVSDPIELSTAVGEILQEIASKAGIDFRSVYLSISGLDLDFKHSFAIMPLVERGNKIITPLDLAKIQKQALVLGSCLEEEVIHQIPQSYLLDSKKEVKNPLGLYSHKLELDLYLICAKSSSLRSFTRIINQAGYDVKKIFFSGLATAAAIFDEELKRTHNIAICDIGSQLTEYLFFQDGCLRAAKVLAWGGDRFTHYLAQELKISYELAEEVKKRHGSIGPIGHNGEEKEILIKQNSVYKPIKQKVIVELLTAESENLCRNLKDGLQELLKQEKPDLLLITGGTVLLDGFIEMLEANLNLPVRLARIKNPHFAAQISKNSILSGPKANLYLTALGVVCLAYEEQIKSYLEKRSFSLTSLRGFLNRIMEIYHDYF